MILILEQTASIEAIENLRQRLKFMGFDSTIEITSNHKAIALISGIDEQTQSELFSTLPLVEKVELFQDRFKLVSYGLKREKSIIEIKDIKIGGENFTVMAGPCTIESEAQIFAIAEAVSAQGASILRGGAFKPRTSPYDFQGLGAKGLQFMRKAADQYSLLCISELMSAEELPLLEQYVDIIQIGSRNMQNFSLLKALGKAKKPILLKRGLSATYKEFLSAAEYIISSGNHQVILCERGIRTFETYTRNTLDIAAVPILRELTHLPIIIDPSHGVGLRNMVAPMANAALAVGADGLIVEVHTNPDQSISDAQQTICPLTFKNMMTTLREIGAAVGKQVSSGYE